MRYLFFVISILCLFGLIQISPSYAVNDTDRIIIPEWIKNIAGWWAEGLISDAQYAATIKYLLQEGIINIETQTSNDKPKTSTSNTFDEKLSSNNVQPYVQTDKLEYTLDDVITITGNVNPLLTEIPEKKNLAGELIIPERTLKVELRQSDMRYSYFLLGINCYVDTYRNSCSSGGDYSFSVINSSYTINDDGTFSFKIKVTDDFEANQYYFTMNYYVEEYGTVTSATSESFEITAESKFQQHLKEYVITDKSEYTLDDTILVTGQHILTAPKKIDGSFDLIDSLSFNVVYLDGEVSDMYDRVNRNVECVRNDGDTFERLPDYNFEPKAFYNFQSILNGSPEKCNISKDGKYELKFHVNNEYYAGTYVIQTAGIQSEQFVIISTFDDS